MFGASGGELQSPNTARYLQTGNDAISNFPFHLLLHGNANFLSGVKFRETS